MLYAIDGSPPDALAFLRDEPLTIEPAVLDVGRGNLGEERRVQIRVKNHTDRSIYITGGNATCKCITTEGLPITVPARGARMLWIKVMFLGRTGAFQQRFELYVNDESVSVIVAHLQGYIVKTSK